MKHEVVSKLMWVGFEKGFREFLPILTLEDSDIVMSRSKKKYMEICRRLPSWQENDVLLVNLLSGASVAAIYLSLNEKPTVEQVTLFYHSVMNDSQLMNLNLKMTKHFKTSQQQKYKREGLKSQESSNPYSWRYLYEEGANLNEFTLRFTQCGICHLFKELGISDITPAMCAYDYEMAKKTNTLFTRKGTIAEGSDCCDCHYSKKIRNNSEYI